MDAGELIAFAGVAIPGFLDRPGHFGRFAVEDH